MDYLQCRKRTINPREKANIFSKLTFFYTLELFKKGYKHDIEENDLYEVVHNLQSKKLGDKLEDEWEKQRLTSKQSITRLFWKCYGWEYLAIGCLQLFVKTIIIVLQPKAVGKLVAFFDTSRNDITEFDAYFYAFLLIALNLAHCIYVHNYHFALMSLGLRVRAAFCSLLYRKVLKLTPQQFTDITIGKIVTLMTKDVAAFEVFIQFANDVWIGFVKTAIVCYFIYKKIGTAALAGIGFYFIVFPLQLLLGRWCAKLRIKMCKKTDERLQVTQEALSAIRIIKMYTWERFFHNKVIDSRKMEISRMHAIFYLKYFILSFIGTLNSELAFYLVIVTYIWFGNRINAEIVYYIQNCFAILTHTLTILLPVGIMNTAELFASIKRIGNTLKVDEIRPPLQNDQITIKPKISMKNIDVTLKKIEILKDINIDIDTGLTLITGPVGSGKTSLLKTILQDYQTTGHLITHGRIAYASQQPWLFPSSIRQNILFGEYYHEKRYHEVLNICALRYDLDMLEYNDRTLVEDRGMNLSRGQQSRINLARAIYKDADIYLLDDCLSALDTQVSDFIFKECIKQFLQNKLVLLVTHNRNYLNDVDNVIVMDKGRVILNAKPSQLDEKIILKTIADIAEKLEKVEEFQDNDHTVNEETKLIKNTNQEVYQETKQSGGVSWSVYKSYVRFGGGIFVLALIFLLFGAAQFVLSYTQKLISQWVNIETIAANYTQNNLTNIPEFRYDIHETRSSMLHTYTIMVITSALLCFIRSIALFVFSRKVSMNLHKLMIDRVMNATMHFFDTHFIGNILNRFSKDLTTIDETLPLAFFHFFRVFFILTGIIILTATVDITFLIPAFCIFIILALIREVYIRTSRSLKRLDSITRSPVVGHLNATLEGATTIRAFKNQKILQNEFDRHQNLNISTFYIMQSCMRAFGYILDTICACFLGIIIGRFMMFKDNTLAGSVGLAISQAFSMVGTLQWGVRQWAEIENQMTSVERALEYTRVKQENKQGVVLENWPVCCDIQYKNVSLIYPNTSERVLKNLNFTINSGGKIGIVGRTGAGKSSIISTLFRLYDVDGRILIDNIDIKTLALDFLRSKISIIPQDPVLFTGTIRDNIDPIRQFSDTDIWKAIELANLKDLITNLDTKITENGSNFSIGQRQLICLARAIVRNNKIIVLDEATANMDRESDDSIHETIRRILSDCTVLIIAHKLRSILNCDKIMVLDRGEIVEFDTPGVLLDNKNSVFYKTVKNAKLIA